MISVVEVVVVVVVMVVAGGSACSVETRLDMLLISANSMFSSIHFSQREIMGNFVVPKPFQQYWTKLQMKA